jgi:PKD repeat protein
MTSSGASEGVPVVCPQLTGLTPTPASGSAPLAVSFQATVNNPSAITVSFQWDFGDGTAVEIGGPSASHTYQSAGTYTATVTANAPRCPPTSLRAQVAATSVCPQLTGLSATPASGPVPLQVAFQAAVDNPSAITGPYRWDFGDGNSAQTAAPTASHAYQSAGTYTAKVTASVPSGCPASEATATVTASQAGGPLAADVPILFLPVRLETRFGVGDSGPELWLRVYPGQIAIDTHEDPLTSQEQADGAAYWAAVEAAGNVPPDDETLKRPWRDLATAHGAPRAAWIAAVSQPGQNSAQATRASTFEKVPTAAALPDFWTVVAYVDGAPAVQATGAAIRRPLPVGLDPQAGNFPPDIPVDEGMRWLVDFDEAVKAGMALRISITPQQQARGFDRIIVYGVRQPGEDGTGDQVIARLLDHHHYTDGVSLAPQGAPTKNTQDAASAFNRQDPGFEISFKVERMSPLTSDPTADGQRSADLLGIPFTTFDHIRFADGKDLSDAEHMARVLWPATLGYFMTEVMADVFTTDQVEGARQYFLDHVRGRGPIAAFRVGQTLYGVLPATSLVLRSRAAAKPSGMLGFLTTATPLWLKSSAGTPRVGGSSDPDQDLAGILGMDASSMTYRSRWVLGDDFTWNFFNFLFGWQSFSAQSPWWQDHFKRARALLAEFGYPGWTPKIAATTLGPDDFTLTYPTVQAIPLSETLGLADDATLSDGSKANYIRWLRQATVDQIRQEAYPGPKPTSLLYRLLRQSLLTEYFNQAAGAQVSQGTLQLSEIREKEFVHLGSQPSITRWEVLDAREPQTGKTWSDYLHDVGPGSPYGPLADLFASLDYLADRPTAELDRLLTETLDVCSHRLDAWITSVATNLLQAARIEGKEGTRLYVGGYGWVEGLHAAASQPTVTGAERQAVAALDRAHPTVATALPRIPGQDNGGYILAPSMAQATTAAVLRSGYLTHRQSSNGQLLAVDLSSKRVRTALWIVDAVRQGQSLAAVLGYQFEQALIQAGLQRYQQAFRDKYQLADGQLTPGQPGETVAASEVVNGLALHADWTNGVLAPGVPWDPTLPQPGADQNKAVEVLKTLDDLMDALSDLSIAESVHQITHGNPARAGGILDAMSKGERPPDLQVLNTPRGGLDLTHRVVLLLADGGQLHAGWAGVAHPRAAAEPRLNAWLSQWLPDPALVKCYVTYTSAGAAVTKPVLLSEHDIGPLDLLAMAQTADVAQAGELERRILYQTVPHGATDAAISFALTAGADDANISFPDAAFAARAWRDLARSARPLSPADLIDPDRASSPANDGQADLAEINQRADDARKALQKAIDDLNAASGGPDAPIHAALYQASYLGVAAAIPDSVDETGATLSGRVTAALDQLNQRKANADSTALPAARPSGAVAVIRAVLGEEFMALPLFSPPDNTNLQLAFANSNALTGTDLDALARWMQQLTHIRPAVSRLDMALAATQLLNGTPRPAVTLAQIPFKAGEPWVGAKLPPTPPPPGRLSVAAIAMGDYTHSTSYAGLLIDEWPERIPGSSATAGLTFHYTEPQSRAPQTLLLAVCPDQRPAWNDEAIQAIVGETLDLAKIRTVDLDSLQEVGQILPALYFPFNDQQETISADILGVGETGTR